MMGDDTSKNKKKESKNATANKEDLTKVASSVIPVSKSSKVMPEDKIMMKKTMLEAEKKNKMGHKATGVSKDLKTVYFTDPNMGEYHITPDGRQVFVSKPSLVGQTDQYIIKR